MISYLEGKIEYSADKYVILNAGGIGYKVNMVPKLLNSISKCQPPVKLFVHSQLNMREGIFDLYGFDKREDLELFHLLISVSGIGPKNALNIMSSVEPKHLKAAVINNDPDYLKKISGLGPKTARRLIMELQNKVDYLEIGDMKGIDLGQEGEATEALLTLGYTLNQAKEALKEDAKGKTLEQRVREALKLLGKNRK
ncbi:MAG: Holliday junction ATP-dependent DNA helicase RuvA [Candidatus Woesebacteria bacterium GW2011_GWA1_39_8]|uniref:Holliday junction branch migration complex subunit RuvA n=1 Tax=Candidatus Woesebacteria bacterium GW2011_GWA1_39_8 TaxID=1618552 RepID=A0A0G0SSZ9_9BACT|nr:MAG: Holliday junction ATP-dependent DNA helicase RuvA [Candidatus Woesebacteria bacterium GW2011_GWA1_39_8]